MTIAIAKPFEPHLPAIARWLRQLFIGTMARKSLSRLSGAHLRDIGLTRADIDALQGLPLSADVFTHLQIRASCRTGNW